jgi:hypothetical protein
MNLNGLTYDTTGVVFYLKWAAANAYPAEPVYESIYDFIDQWEDSRPLAHSFFLAEPSLVIQAIVHGMAIIREGKSLDD